MDTNRILPYFLDEEKRDLVLILPGGAYEWTSPREGFPVVEAFHDLGCHAAIYEYRRTKLPFPTDLEEALAFALALQKDPRICRFLVLGFSAGGHLALRMMEKKPSLFDGGILAYPVVTADLRHWHEKSITNLLDGDLSPKRIRAVSLEKHIAKKMPPIFLWHTLDDQSVPVENSFLLLEALKKKGIPVEAHFFPHGRHGLSLAVASTVFQNEDPVRFSEENRHVSSWFGMMADWLRRPV